ncbi:hypothetical protein [Fontibacillus sp. BL9]|uniref:hypothetical protein n=1 Tax=Fontibacillus sp. BL9 TaxID=3389971 RepID=UPI00397A44A0
MSRIVFWDYGHDGSAELAAAGAVCMALAYPGRILLLNEEQGGTGIEAGFSFPDHIRGGDIQSLPEYGMDALQRLAANQRLTPGNFSDYTYPVIKDKLDLVSGFGVMAKKNPAMHEESLRLLYSAAEQAFDMVFTRSKHPPNYADLHIRVVALRQNRLELERFFDEFAHGQPASPLADAIVLQHYDPQSRWSAANIRRRFESKIPMFPIPYNTEFMDAWNNRNILKYIRLHRLMLHKGSLKRGILPSLLSLCEGLLELAAGRTEITQSGKRGA